MLAFADSVGLGPKELAHLLGVSVRTIRRGAREGGTADLLLRGLREKLMDPKSALSIRALTIISARSDDGLKALMDRLTRAYVTLDQLRL